MYKQFVKHGFESTCIFANDCLDEQFVNHFSYCNFRTEPRYIALLPICCITQGMSFELYWSREFLVCCNTSDVCELLQQWVNEDNKDSTTYAWLLNQIQQNEYTNFDFVFESLQNKMNTRQLGEKIAVALLMKGKIALGGLDTDEPAQLRYYATGTTSRNFTAGSIYFETEHYLTIAQGQLWRIYW
jgi:hypothetical protein